MDGRDLLTIGEVAGRAGTATSALRYYEEQGLVASVRSAGGQRRYPRSVLRRLSFVRAAQNVGLSLGEIRTALDALPPAARRRKRIGLGCRGPGRPGSTSRSLVCRSSATASPAASAAAACHCAPARCRTPDMLAAQGSGARYFPSLRRPPPRDAPQASTDRPAPDADMVHVQIRGFHKLGTRPTVRSWR